MGASLPAALAPSTSVELVVSVADADVAVTALRFPGVAMLATEIRQHGTTRGAPEQPVDAATLDAALLALIAHVPTVPAGSGLTVEVRRAGRVEQRRSMAPAVARGQADVAAAIEAIFAMVAAQDAAVGTALASAWAGA